MSGWSEQASHTGGSMHRPTRHDGVAVLLLSFACSPQRCDGRTWGKAQEASSSPSRVFLRWPSMPSFSSSAQLMNAEQFSHRLI